MSKLYKVLALSTAAILAVILFQNFTEAFFSWICVLFLLLVLVASVLIFKSRLSGNILLCIILCISFALRLACVIILDPEISSDFSILLDSGIGFLNGDKAAYHLHYFSLWGYQIPFSLYEGFIYKVFGSVIAIKLFNLFFSTGLNILIYFLASLIASDRASITAAFLYAVSPAAVLYVPVLTNQHVSCFFILLGLYWLLRGDSLPRSAAAGAFIALGNLMRPEAILIIVSVSASAALLFIGRHNPGNALSILKNTGAAVLSFFILMQSASFIFDYSGISENGISNSLPQWKLVIGLNDEYCGQNRGQDTDLLEIRDDEKMIQSAKRRAEDRFEEIDSYFTFFSSKSAKMWGERDDLYWPLHHINRQRYALLSISWETMIEQIQDFDRAVFLLALIAAFAASLRWFLSKNAPIKSSSVFMFLICANYFAYLLIEIQHRYRYFIVPVFIIVAAAGIELLDKTDLTLRPKASV